MRSGTSADPVFFDRGDGLLEPTEHARGPWDEQALHGGAPAALLAREIERAEPGSAMFVARITFEFLGPVPQAPLRPLARVVRPGKRLQIVEAELRADDTVVLRARAMRLRRGELAAGATERKQVPGEGPQTAVPSPFPEGQGTTGFHRSTMEIRFADGSSYGRGPAKAWFRLTRPLVAGEEPTPLQRVVAAADFGNGVSRELDFSAFLFVNTDLTVNLEREPLGEWVLLDAQTSIAEQGTGLATSTLYDEHGRIGVSAQTLFVDAR